MDIDIALDLSFDAMGKDPDIYSPTLKAYHQILWSKQLPIGGKLELMSDTPNTYLSAQVAGVIYNLSSDSIGNSYQNSNAKVIQNYLYNVDSQLVTEFRRLNNTIGGFILFPANRVDGQMTINGARGFNPKIADRFDLTLECIRLFYNGETSPLHAVLSRYVDFFLMFVNFRNYVDYFLLNDLVTREYLVKFFIDQDEVFRPSGYPQDVAEYLEYRSNSMEFVSLRNSRIRAQTEN